MSTADLTKAIPKISDFGVATIKEHTTASTHAGGGVAAGTTAWKASETFRGRYNQATDIFGMGVTSFEIVTRRQPYESMSFPEILRSTQLAFEYDPEMEEDFPESHSKEQQQARFLKRIL